MTPEERIKDKRRQEMLQREQMKRRQMRKKQIKQHKRRMRILFCVEMIAIFCLISFWLGRCSGVNKMQEESYSTTGDNSVYHTATEADIDVLEINTDDESSERDGSGYSILKQGSAEDTEEKILLVNKDNKLPDNYEVELLTLPDGVNRAAAEAYEPLCAMLKAGQKEGLNFEICSSYRDVERQQELFDEDVEDLIRKGYSYKEAYDEVAKETMPPGYSEHSTGLAFDIVSLGYQMLDEGQEYTDENKWLQEHCAEYGFILRYPKGKEEITQINYESWHFRYVGVEAAEYIMEQGITLEEYLEL